MINMVYLINGKQLAHDGGECGIYKSQHPVQRMEYAIMDMDILVRAINDMPVERAIEGVTQLREQASQQANWQHTPQNPGFPILRQLPEPDIDIDEVRGNIRNTERFCNDVLKVLKGQ